MWELRLVVRTLAGARTRAAAGVPVRLALAMPWVKAAQGRLATGPGPNASHLASGRRDVQVSGG